MEQSFSAPFRRYGNLCWTRVNGESRSLLENSRMEVHDWIKEFLDFETYALLIRYGNDLRLLLFQFG